MHYWIRAGLEGFREVLPHPQAHVHVVTGSTTPAYNTMGRKQTHGVSSMPSHETGDETLMAKPKKRKTRKEIGEMEELEAYTEPASEGLVHHEPPDNREAMSPQEQDIPPQKKKKKKRAPALDLKDEQRNLTNGDAQETQPHGAQVIRKGRKKKNPKTVENRYTDELGVEENDIVTDTHCPSAPRISAPPGHSQPLSKVFVERNRCFQDTVHLDLGHKHPEDVMEMRPVWNTRDVAVSVHSSFRIIGYFTHGFLAGYAVWNIIVIYVLSGEQLTTLPNLLQQYNGLAYPAQSLMYLLLTISTVSAFDRVNLARTSLAIRGFLMLDPVALTSFLYFAALVLSLSQQMTSDRINLYPTATGTLWPPGSEHQILQPWIVVNLVIALLAGLAWIFISTRPDMDYTEEYLMAMEIDEYQPHDEKSDITA